MSASLPPTRPSSFVRMWHLQNGKWCHSFDVADPAYRSWKEGNGPLSRMSVFLPNGKNPANGSQVVCGTCGSARINPVDMRQEFMRA